MTSFQVNFWNPWLLFLLIPALLFTLIPYFRLNKKYRRTRNRILSMVLHLLVMTLAITVLAGISFTYTVINPENEIILLVDVSDTESESAAVRDEFVRTVLTESKYDGYHVGVVTFGFTQNYVVPLTDNLDSAYEDYLGAELPDTSATDIAAAIRYASTLFNYPDSAKIVLITDGKETDESATTAIGSVIAQGIRIDTAYIGSEYENDVLRVTGINLPTTHISEGDRVSIEVTIRQKEPVEATVSLYDNDSIDNETGVIKTDATTGERPYTFSHVFSGEGLHRLEIRISDINDPLDENNSYSTYLYLEVYNHVLLVDNFEGDGDELEAILGEDAIEYEVDRKNLMQGDELPDTVDGLRAYDQVILNNVANEDLPEGFDRILYEYVSVYGGGLFTVGGNDPGTNEAHSFRRSDMRNTVYESLLPVQVIDYTPPVAVIVIIDVSGSMSSDGGGGRTLLQWAKNGAVACLEALTERDYIGVMTLDTVQEVKLRLTKVTEQTRIREAIMGIEGTGGTTYAPALSRAQEMLTGVDVERRHIILVTDGQPGDKEEDFLPIVRDCGRNGITISTVAIGTGGADVLNKIVTENGGKGKFYEFTSQENLVRVMHNDLLAPEIKEQEIRDFTPVVSEQSSVLFKDVELKTMDDSSQKAFQADLGGFFGVRLRSNADAYVEGEFGVPIYAQWKVDKGTVGCFMSELKTEGWGDRFVQDAGARTFLRNVVKNLMPTENIRKSEITVRLREENYINQLNVNAGGLEDGETVSAYIECPDSTQISLNELPKENTSALDCYVTIALNAANGYTRCNFVVKASGVYRLHFEKRAADGTVKDEVDVYKSFSYSQEYVELPAETETDELEPSAFLEDLARRGKGQAVKDLQNPEEIFQSFTPELIHTFDPRWLFMALAMVLFLLDIIVRKFKFKWPHELIREYRKKKEEQSEQ